MTIASMSFLDSKQLLISPMTDSTDDFPSSWMKSNALHAKAGRDLILTTRHRPADTFDFRPSVRAVRIGELVSG